MRNCCRIVAAANRSYRVVSCDMGDGKEGERQPLLKNENVTYSSHGSDAIVGAYCKLRIGVHHDGHAVELSRRRVVCMHVCLMTMRIILSSSRRDPVQRQHRLAHRAGRVATTLSIRHSRWHADGYLQSMPGDDRYFGQEGSARGQVLSM